MAFFGNLIKTFLSSEGPSGNTVTEVSVSQFSRTPVSIFFLRECKYIVIKLIMKIYMCMQRYFHVISEMIHMYTLRHIKDTDRHTDTHTKTNI